MSEDLRYYFFNNEEEGNMPVSADEGWDKMCALLNTHMPEKKVALKKLFKPYLISLLFITACVMFYLPLTENRKTEAYAKRTALMHADDLQNTTINSSASSNKLKAHFRLSQPQTKIDVHKAVQQLIQNNHVTANTNASLHDENPAGYRQPIDIKTIESIPIILEKDTASNTSEKSASSQKISIKNKCKWTLQAGAGLNISMGKYQVPQPYPTFDIKYATGRRFYVSTGIAIFSPVATSGISGIEKTVYVNDTLNNVSMYNEKIEYKRLHYIDLPVIAGWQLSDKISVQAGIQLSRLISSKSSTASEPYDFNMNRVYADVGTLLPTAAPPPVENNIEIRKMDYRLLGGIEYNLNRQASISLQYQQGLRPVLTGYSAPDKRNSLITLKVKVKIN